MKQKLQLCSVIFALTLTLNTSRAASLTYQVTHNWATNPPASEPALSLSAIPRFDPALGTLTNVICTLVGLRRTDWEAAAPFQFGTYSIGTTAQFWLRAPELSGFPTLDMVDFATPNVSTGGFLAQGETASGTLISTTNRSGNVTTDLQRFVQTNQYFVTGIYGLDGGSTGTGSGGTFNYVLRSASTTVTVIYQYTPVTPPTLTIAPATPGNATISWSPNTPGYLLQQTALLSPSNWTNSPSGATNPIVVPANQAARFYRLFKP